MQIGVVYPQIELGGDPAAVKRIGLATEELGYDYLLAFDHVLGAEHANREPALTGPYTDKDPFHDPFVLFAYLAGMTERINFATGVLILPQRQTALVAKQAADLDLMSGERFRLGVGTGWNYVEYDALGENFADRGPRLTEQIGFLRQLWTEPLVTFSGTYDALERGNIAPRPKRSIPIWLGGFSEPAFRRAGRLGDGFVFAGSIDRCVEGMGRIETHAGEAGRELVDFGNEYLKLGSKNTQETIDAANRWREVGGTHFGVVSMGMGLDSTEAHLDFFATVKAALSD